MLKSIVLVATLVASALAQSATSQAMPAVATASFNPGLVNDTRRLQWCQGQHNTCNAICGGRTDQNNCDENSLTYTCQCINGTYPDCTAYEESLPYFICEETYAQCMNTHPSTDPDGQAQCIRDRECGNLTAELSNAMTTTAAASSTGASSTGSASATAATTTSSKAAAISITPISSGAFAALLFALCRLVL